jgi:beta-fructofuranosidase
VTAPATPADRTGEWLPTYHLTGSMNWINDPNGLTWRGDRYHVFYQANPAAPVWGPPSWGHATSPDLRHWQRHPLALIPSADGPDRDGCWSGCLTFVEGVPTIFYTGVVGFDNSRVESICVARGSADLMRWTVDREPLVHHAPAELIHGYHRDPFVWRDEKGWHLIVGTAAASAELRGAVGIYHSSDALDWTWDGLLVEDGDLPGAIDLGKHWECPQLVKVGDSWVLIMSVQDPDASKPLLHSVSFTGELDANYRFHPHTSSLLDAGDAFYAATIGIDAHDRLATLGWIQERLPAEQAGRLGKAGAVSLPRRLSIRAGQLRPTLHPAWATADRGDVAAVEPRHDLTSAFMATLPGDGSRQQSLEMISHHGSDRVDIQIDPNAGTLRVDVHDLTGARCFTTPTTESCRDAQPLMTFCDGSILEVFAPGCVPITTRWYRRAPVARIGTALHDEPDLAVRPIKPLVGDHA